MDELTIKKPAHNPRSLSFHARLGVILATLAHIVCVGRVLDLERGCDLNGRKDEEED